MEENNHSTKPPSRTVEVLISTEHSNKRADISLTEMNIIESRSQVKKLFSEKKITVNGKSIKPSHILQAGDNVILEILLPLEETLIPYDIPLDIVFEDEHVLVVNKPSGLVVHPAAGHAHDTLVNAVLAHHIQLSQGSAPFRPGLVHRIDKDTSGLLVLAKDDKTHNSLARQFKNKTVHRKYVAIVFGKLKDSTSFVESYIARHPEDRKRFIATDNDQGKWAKTHYTVLEESAHLSLIELVLETGRTHQIRVHMSHIGHPIVGDDLYNGKKRAHHFSNIALRHLIKDMPRFALHAKELGFTHPIINKRLEFSSPWPENLKQLYTLAGFTTNLDSNLSTCKP